MPERTPRPCLYPGCPELVTNTSRCPEHAQAYDQQRKTYDKQRGTFHQRGYTMAWRNCRAAFIRRNPRCKSCLERGLITPAVEVDHIVPIKQGGSLIDPKNLQALCRRCHARKTAADQEKYRGGA